MVSINIRIQKIILNLAYSMRTSNSVIFDIAIINFIKIYDAQFSGYCSGVGREAAILLTLYFLSENIATEITYCAA